MFEDEFRQMQLNPVRIEYLLKDACMLFPPTTTPLSDVEFIKRLPSGDIERARRVSERVQSERQRSIPIGFAVDPSVFLAASRVVGLTLDAGNRFAADQTGTTIQRRRQIGLEFVVFSARNSFERSFV